MGPKLPMRIVGFSSTVVVLLAMAGEGVAKKSTGTGPGPDKKWRDNPKMVVFGDSQSDAGRRFNAPASFVFEDIGPFPWTKLYEAPDSESTFQAYLPGPGSVTNGNVWTEWLRVPKELNFATHTASATEMFRSRDTCLGYTGEGEEFPTGTLDEQITRYLHEADLEKTRDYTHVVYIGIQDCIEHEAALFRYYAGGDDYEDPYIPFDQLFTVVDGADEVNFEPLIAGLGVAWQAGVSRLIEAGVTGRILLGNIGNPEGFEQVIGTQIAERLRSVTLEISNTAQSVAEEFPEQVRILDNFALKTAFVDQPEIFENLGFYAPEGGVLLSPCLVPDFQLDVGGEISGTQALRPPGCQEECALCADTPCQTCFEGNPSAQVCSDPDSRILWAVGYFSNAFHRIYAEAIRVCSMDSPDYGRPWVELMCPPAS